MQSPSAPPGSTNNPLTKLPGGLKQKQLIVIIIAVVAVVILGIVVNGMVKRNLAENIAENAIERAGGGDVKVDLDNKTWTYETNEGSFQVGEGVDLPANWPADVPVLSGVKITYAGSTNPQTGQAGASVMFTTTQSTAEVAAYYNSELVKAGWTIEGTANSGGVNIISAQKGGRQVGLYMLESDGSTTVTIGIQE